MDKGLRIAESILRFVTFLGNVLGTVLTIAELLA
jgi:hypothetical protein